MKIMSIHYVEFYYKLVIITSVNISDKYKR